MTLYVDSSALLKRYIEEPDSSVAEAHLGSNTPLVTARHTIVEVRRNLARLLEGAELAEQRAAFTEDAEVLTVVELDAGVCETAATVAEELGVRSLDALHLGAAMRLGGTQLSMLTFDIRLAQAARSLGFIVLGT